MILELDNVELYYKTKPILSNLYLKAETDRITTIIGRNGAGKSSLLQIVFGDLKPKYKLLRIDGKVIFKPLFTYGKTKYLPEFPLTPKKLKIKTAFKKYGVDWGEFKSIFPEFKPEQGQSFSELSTGEKRMLELFMVLKSAGDIVLLDEPFKSLSPVVVERFKQLITEEKRRKIVICADNNEEHWNGFSEKTYLLKNRTLAELT
jgi:ABC-type branched-subunit amino acid transport system ATPase component